MPSPVRERLSRSESQFVSADISKISKFEKDSADAHKTETDHILVNIGGIKDILDSIINGAVKDIYTQFDNDLGEFNKNPQAAEENGSSEG